MGAPDFWTMLSGAGGAGTVVAFWVAKEWYSKRNGNGQPSPIVALTTEIKELKGEVRKQNETGIELKFHAKANGETLKEMLAEMRRGRG